MALLVNHSWPGNVRELRNAVERFLLLAGDELITPDRLRGMIQIDEPAPPKAPESS
jgi:DNA-binding NtrC family response regulator